jgi:hypothetical protein
VAALVRLEALVKGGAVGSYEGTFLEMLRPLRDPLLEQAVDRRSVRSGSQRHIFGQQQQGMLRVACMMHAGHACAVGVLLQYAVAAPSLCRSAARQAAQKCGVLRFVGFAAVYESTVALLLLPRRSAGLLLRARQRTCLRCLQQRWVSALSCTRRPLLEDAVYGLTLLMLLLPSLQVCCCAPGSAHV